MSTPQSLWEPARKVAIAQECDLCIIGGSCTGVFAAVRAARLGLSVALVESNVLFGGMATAAQVNEWHSLHSVGDQQQIIGGLTAEMLDRLLRKNAVKKLQRKHRGTYYLFNSAELALELDSLVREHAIRPYLKASCVGAIREGDHVSAAVIEDKSGRRAIKARMFIDASGDGDLLRRAGFSAWKNEHLQPVTYQALIAGLRNLGHFWSQMQPHLDRYNYPRANSHPWVNSCGYDADLNNVYGPRLNGVDASDADQLTAALLESRRCHQILLEIARTELGGTPACVGLAHAMGVRETWHAQSLYRVEAKDLLFGKYFPDAIAFGTYPVDVHSAQGTLLRHLDGREESVAKDGSISWSRWRSEEEPCPAFYTIPYRSLVPDTAENLLVAGRLLDADREAFGGLRVMVNMNQTGEAAGTAAFLALKDSLPVAKISSTQLRSTMSEQGSIVPGK